MYKQQQPVIRHYALTSPKHTLHVIGFVLSSINQRFYRVGNINEVLRNTGDTPHLSKFQRKAWQAICSESQAIFNFVVANGQCDAFTAIDFYSQLPGLGIVKAGFCAQLLHGVGGCLDRHWLKELGLSPSAFNASGVTPKRRARMLQLYCDTLDTVGTCAYLWDSWCHTVASLYPAHFYGAEHVSQYHWEAITGKEWPATKE